MQCSINIMNIETLEQVTICQTLGKFFTSSIVIISGIPASSIEEGALNDLG